MKKLAIVTAFVALAGQARQGRADDRGLAEKYFRAGAQAYSAQNFAAAASDFDEAYKAMPLPEIAFSGAQAYRRLYRVDPKAEYVKRSVELYRAYLDKVKSGGRAGDAADSLGEMERELDRLKVTMTSTTIAAVERTRIGVSVTVTDEHVADTAVLREIGDVAGMTGSSATKGLTAMLDGKPLEPFALVDVDATEHVIAVSADGYLPVEKKAMAVKGQSQLIEIELHPKQARIAVKTEADAQISIDGRIVATSPASPVEVAAGKHLLAIVHRGREPFGRELVATRGQVIDIDAKLEMTTRRRAVPYVVGGAGALAAAAITTSIFALVHQGRASDLQAKIGQGNRPPSDADAYDNEVRSRDQFATATWILGGVALAAAGTGAFLYFFDHPSSDGVRFEPIASGSSSAGLAVRGKF